MNERFDIERTLESWMRDDAMTMPDRIVDVVARRIAIQPQQRSWPFRRRTNVTPIKLVAALAAVMVVAVVGYTLLPRQPSSGGDPSPSTVSTPSIVPTASPSASEAVVDVREEALPAGRYRFRPFADDPTFAIVATIPAGWGGVPPWAVTGPNGTEAPSGIAVAFLAPDGLFGDPCRWDVDGTGAEGQPGDIEVGPKAIDLVTALRANDSYVSNTPTPVTLGTLSGYEMEIELPVDVEIETCDQVSGDSEAIGRYFVFSGESAGLFAQGNGNRWRLFIVEDGDRRVVIAGPYYATTPQADQEAFRGIIESLEFTP
jgi:hypothetical protein